MKTGPKPIPVEDRIWQKVVKRPGGCWDWCASLNEVGYGKVWAGKHSAAGNSVASYAHRVVYELLVGPIPEGLDLDHLCRNRRCVNPEHLEPVTRRENLNRGHRARGVAGRGHSSRVTRTPY